MTSTDIAALLGIIFGTIGAIIGTLSYFRDKVKIVITLQWDMKILNNPEYNPDILWGLVTATNVGRRPIYISKIVLTLPKRYDLVLLLYDSIKGVKLSEGDPPATNIINQKELEDYAKEWKKIRVKVNISICKINSSQKIKRNTSATCVWN